MFSVFVSETSSDTVSLCCGSLVAIDGRISNDWTGYIIITWKEENLSSNWKEYLL